MDSLRMPASFPEAMDKLTSFFRAGGWSQEASTAYSSTAATPLNSDYGSRSSVNAGHDSRRGSKQKREPSLVWAMQSHRSIDGDLRDYCLYPGRVEVPTGRLTSVDPRFPTECDLDKLRAYGHGSAMPVSCKAIPVDNSADHSRPQRQDIACDQTDVLDQQVAHCIRQHPSNHVVTHVGHGKYEINHREVTCRWVGGTYGYVEVVDGPMKQRLADYLDGKDETAVYERDGGCAIGKIAKENRLSFGDEQHQNYTRLEAMRVAKEQAKLRESAAKASDTMSNYHNFEDHLHKYRTWHNAQLKVDVPMHQRDADDAQVISMLQAPQSEAAPMSARYYRSSQAERTLPPNAIQ